MVGYVTAYPVTFAPNVSPTKQAAAEAAAAHILERLAAARRGPPRIGTGDSGRFGRIDAEADVRSHGRDRF